MAHLIDLSDFPLVGMDALRNQQAGWILEPRLYLDPILDCIAEEEEEEFEEIEEEKRKKKKKKKKVRCSISHPQQQQDDDNNNNPIQEQVRLHGVYKKQRIWIDAKLERESHNVIIVFVLSLSYDKLMLSCY